MLRKVKRDQSKGELMLDHCSNFTQKHKSTSFFRIPSLFVGFTPKSVSDCDSVRSPTSPLDAIIFSSFGCSLWSQKSEPDSFQSPRKSWCSEGIGLGIVGSLTDVETRQAENCAGKSDTKNILFGSQLRINVPKGRRSQNHYLDKIVPPITSPKSLPNYVFSAQSRIKSGLSNLGCSQVPSESNAFPLEAGKSIDRRPCSSGSIPNSASFLSRHAQTDLLCSESNVNLNNSASDLPQLDVGLHGFPTSSNCNLRCALSASEIELSEDYTCVITHGPNPKTKHIYGDYILEENCMFEIPAGSKPDKMNSDVTSPDCQSFLLDDFLSICFACKKNLVQGEDIYIGDKAFCSSECRAREMIMDEGMEDTLETSPPPSKAASSDEVLFPS
ncbi:FCS-Like Zinc finger 8-like isoform X2 [Nymphaea colorata]|uniref:FCS-Like Zinc finger 8-like isoform X2 n=1 Tax=Nymphaea colorata TaxID=210225 RepID=UPI00129EC36A|nr:FCS-Like Zinc finger 8-like isoform X2 [Nymphaea colorata]